MELEKCGNAGYPFLDPKKVQSGRRSPPLWWFFNPLLRLGKLHLDPLKLRQTPHYLHHQFQAYSMFQSPQSRSQKQLLIDSARFQYPACESKLSSLTLMDESPAGKEGAFPSPHQPSWKWKWLACYDQPEQNEGMMESPTISEPSLRETANKPYLAGMDGRIG